MRSHVTYLFTAQTFKELLQRPGTKLLVILLNVLAAYALFVAYEKVSDRRAMIEEYQTEVRERWEGNPDKHPHRMAHYGYVAFRPPYTLSFFDRGVDNYVGNAVFLEAHRQNTVNYSAASLSSGLMRFGELSASLILQALLPLVIFFWGFALVAGERDDGKLRLVFAQGATWPEVIIGKSLGLFGMALLVLLPIMLLTGILTILLNPDGAAVTRYGLLNVLYAGYTLAICLLTVWISALSGAAKTALLRLIGCWLLFVLVLPKIAQVGGQLLHPSPTRVAFNRAIEEDLLKTGDSHNPDDPYFQGLKDSVLAAHGVATTAELPFNYGGFVMREGEKLSTQIFRSHERGLMGRFESQRRAVGWTAFLNPYVAIKYASMALAGTDYRSYRRFKDEAESYRYDLAQAMNELQMEHISNVIKSSSDKRGRLDRRHWAELPVFAPSRASLGEALRAEWPALLALLLWLAGLFGLALFIRRLSSVI